jgi:hypothetical protein
MARSTGSEIHYGIEQDRRGSVWWKPWLLDDDGHAALVQIAYPEMHAQLSEHRC